MNDVDTLAAGGDMSGEDQDFHPGSEIDLAIGRALEAANLRAGDPAGSTALVAHREPSAVELDGEGSAGDGD